MKRLLLLRHAKAEPAEQPLADIARKLAARGERDARWIGERLFRHGLVPDRIIASPAARALHTAQLVAAAVGYPSENIAILHPLYLAEPAAIRGIVAAENVRTESLLVVGHNPGLSELVLDLFPSFEVDDLPTAAVVALAYADATEWAHLDQATARLVYYDFPKNTGAPFTGP
jgi:phosphohistidine phosphatase